MSRTCISLTEAESESEEEEEEEASSSEEEEESAEEGEASADELEVCLKNSFTKDNRITRRESACKKWGRGLARTFVTKIEQRAKVLTGYTWVHRLWR